MYNGEVKDKCLEFTDVSCDQHADAIAELIRQFLTESECNEKLVAQTYDGAATLG